MKTATAMMYLSLAVACGDNIHPPGKDFPDVSVDPKPEEVTPDDEVDAGTYATEDAFVGEDETDAALPDAPVPEVCEDSHIDLNGHEHKCQHDQELPDRP